MYYFQTKATYDKQNEEGIIIRATEEDIIPTHTFALAEEQAEQHLRQFYTEIDIKAITRTKYTELITREQQEDDKFFKCKINIITLNENTGKPKKEANYYLVQAQTALEAHQIVDKQMKHQTTDYSIEQVDETKIVEIIQTK